MTLRRFYVPDFAPGDLVIIVRGPFESFEATVTAIDHKHSRVTAEINIFENRTSVELELRDLVRKV
ncbi:MAG: hypothetical protein HON53_14475 [Planctomycetaceae bacterium]|jgi:transcription antitermination factor NusG|nr:hypothetical protein [Planctomycetaceae bacterium]MBT6156691.1 hypothetical protein [Planctomycetaceae bacterium]MBT6486443.1 hypothetical protein [Planctomycetaceae bacterium]MBT6493718.1 hypothetical protein [Planctomycetaceae bacterium]